MLKNIAQLECKVGEKVVQLLCDNDTPTASLKEALFQFSKFVGQIEDNAKAQMFEKQQVEVQEKENCSTEECSSGVCF